MPGCLWLFTCYLVVSYSVYVLLKFWATSHNVIFVVLQEDGANVSIHKGGVFFHQRDTQFTYHFNEQHST